MSFRQANAGMWFVFWRDGLRALLPSKQGFLWKHGEIAAEHARSSMHGLGVGRNGIPKLGPLPASSLRSPGCNGPHRKMVPLVPGGAGSPWAVKPAAVANTALTEYNK